MRGGTRQLMQITTDAARDVRDFCPSTPVPARAIRPDGEAGPPGDPLAAASANARNTVYFLVAPEDARVWARHTSAELNENDLAHLDALHRGRPPRCRRPADTGAHFRVLTAADITLTVQVSTP